MMIGWYVLSRAYLKELQNSHTIIEEWRETEELAREIIWLDEVLTQSARNYVFTEDAYWKERYDRFGLELDEKVQQAKRLASDKTAVWLFLKIDEANIALVKLETEALDLVAKGERDRALSILDSKKYTAWKEFYGNAAQRFLQLSENAKNQYEQVEKSAFAKWFVFSPASLTMIVLVSLWIALWASLSISRSLQEIEKSLNAFLQGDFSRRVPMRTTDEIGRISDGLNKMANAMQKSSQNGHLEQKANTNGATYSDKR